MSSASFVFNQIIEKDKDAQMERTKNRPLPRGEISPLGASIGGVVLILLSFLIFILYVNLLAALVAFSGFVSYIFLYTIWLKPRTDQNIVIGGVAGCVGPLIGYAASTDTLPLPGWILFLIIFLWTPAHFWALAIFLKEDYNSANFPMMPVLQGIPKTTKSILVYTILYSFSCIAFYFSTDRVGFLYLGITIILCVYMTYLAIQLYKVQSREMAKSFFFFSIFHLFFINILILADYSLQWK
jgi:protoheme IX farnesyltransferase